MDLLAEVLSDANVASLLLVFWFGTFIGSFVNVCIGRLPVGKSIVWPGSACTSCGVPLAWWHNLPILSYVALRGRCHYCRSRFSMRYLLMELLTGALAALTFAHTNGPSYEFLYLFTFGCLLIIVFFVDLDAWIILDEVNFFGVAAGIIGAWWLPARLHAIDWVGLGLTLPPGGLANVLWHALGSVLCYLFFLAIAVVGTMLARQEALGRGDVKLAAMIGAFLGPSQGFLALMASFPLGALVAVPLVLLSGRGGKTPIPFGTFMAVAAYAVALYGDSLALWTETLVPGMGGAGMPW